MAGREKRKMPKAAYYQCLWIIKDAKRLQRLADLNCRQGQPDEMVFYHDEETMMSRSEVVEEAAWKIKCIREALQTIPEEYRAAIVESIKTGKIHIGITHENTLKRWRRRFIRELALNLKLI